MVLATMKRWMSADEVLKAYELETLDLYELVLGSVVWPGIPEYPDKRLDSTAGWDMIEKLDKLEEALARGPVDTDPDPEGISALPQSPARSWTPEKVGLQPYDGQGRPVNFFSLVPAREEVTACPSLGRVFIGDVLFIREQVEQYFESITSGQPFPDDFYKDLPKKPGKKKEAMEAYLLHQFDKLSVEKIGAKLGLHSQENERHVYKLIAWGRKLLVDMMARDPKAVALQCQKGKAK